MSYRGDYAEIAKLVESDPFGCPCTAEDVREIVEADWAEGQEHIDWAKSAPLPVIAAWVLDVTRGGF